MVKAPAKDSGHRFGGAWTEIKLDAVGYYLGFYTQVLKDKPLPDRPFELWYIDAFAGSGSRRVDRETGGLFEGEPLGEETVDLAGSVLHALDVNPPFHRLVFIEENRQRFEQLEEIAEANPTRNILPIRGDANEKLREIFTKAPWSYQQNGKGSHRATVFLDPFGMSVRWETLKLLADTGAVDIWYLFPTGAVNRQLAGDFAKVDQHKQRALDEVFGTSCWRENIYDVRTEPSLFGSPVTTTSKTFSIDQIEIYARDRLKSLFAYVSEPLPLLNDRDAKIFSLFCLANSSSPKALGLIKNGVTSVLRRHALK